MKVVLTLLTSLALTAGLFWGYLDHNRSGPPVPAPATPPSPTPGVEARKVPPPPSPTPTPAPAPTPPPEPPVPVPGEEELTQAVRKLEGLILREEFQEASGVARELVKKYQKNPEALRLLEKVRRAEEKARAYSALVAPLMTRQLPEQLFSVSLSNGNTLVAKTVVEAGDRYEMEYVLGGKGALDRDRVSAVAPLSRKAYLAETWKEIQKNVAGLRDPIDLFFFGVKKCFRDGLRREGLSLLDRLLAMPDSGQVVAMFAKDPDGSAVRAWERAAGRAPLLPLAGQAAPEIPVVVGADAGGGDDRLDTAALNRVQTMIEEAEATYRNARGDPDQVFQARTLIMSSTKILFALPGSDPRVRDLNRRAGLLLEKVLNRER